MLSPSQIEYAVDINKILDQLGFPQKSSEIKREGQDFVAPLNSRGYTNSKTNTHIDTKTFDEHHSAASSIGKSRIGLVSDMNKNVVIASGSNSRGGPNGALPFGFDWRLVKDKKTGIQIIDPAASQASCGLCFLAGSVSAFEDRLTIHSRRDGPYLSYTYGLSCNKSNPALSNGCLGGNVVQLCHWIAENGIINHSCSGFQWCNYNERCLFGDMTSTEVNSIMPPCNEKSQKCFECDSEICRPNIETTFTLFYMDPTSIKVLTNINDMKQEIYANGTIAATYRVPQDFMITAIDTSKFPKSLYWAQTGGIYCNIPGVDLYDTGSLDGQLLSDTFIGNHTIAIVGWSAKTVTHPKINSGKPTLIGYWIARNSWTSSWSAVHKGFFMIAMTSSQYNINTRLHLDNLLSYENGAVSFGGGCSTMPAQKTIEYLRSDNLYPIIDFDKQDGVLLNEKDSQAKESKLIVAPPSTPRPGPSDNNSNSNSNQKTNPIVGPSALSQPADQSGSSSSPGTNIDLASSQATTQGLIIGFGVAGGILLIVAIVFIVLFASKRKN